MPDISCLAEKRRSIGELVGGADALSLVLEPEKVFAPATGGHCKRNGGHAPGADPAALPSGMEKYFGCSVRSRDKHLLLGVTGGIATGKSTVVQMFRQKAAPVIDFDLLARKVVEPGKPAWQDIVTYFGRHMLRDDRNLDRKKLAKLVFGDPEQRKKLESFTHPRIQQEFVLELNDIIAINPSAIVLVDMPLLIEFNRRSMFHKILVVYVPEEVQIERLMRRDGISRAEAGNRMKAQVPIDEKVGYADFVINNAGTLAETQRQVDELWAKLRQLQNTR